MSKAILLTDFVPVYRYGESPATPDSLLEPAEYQAEEGNARVTKHKFHERDRRIVILAKKLFKRKHAGKLFCEACGFDFSQKYGERGIDLIEVHHINPMSEREGNEITRVEDLVMLCSNCHSVVHRESPWLSVDELKSIIKGTQTDDNDV